MENKSTDRKNSERLSELYTGTCNKKFQRLRQRMYELEMLVMEQCKQNAVLNAEVGRMKQQKKTHIATQSKDPGWIIELHILKPEPDKAQTTLNAYKKNLETEFRFGQERKTER